jgi:hypothetical protein
VYRSGFLPRFLGVWLIIACLGYLAFSFTGFLFPAYEDKLSRFAQPALLADVAFMLWPVIMGARSSSKSAPATKEREFTH